MRRQGLLCWHLKRTHQPQNDRNKKHHFARDGIGVSAPKKQASHSGLNQHADRINVNFIEPVDNVPSRQGHDQGRHKLKQAHQA